MKKERTLTDEDLNAISQIFDDALTPLGTRIQALIYVLAENFVTYEEFEKLKQRLLELESRIHN